MPPQSNKSSSLKITLINPVISPFSSIGPHVRVLPDDRLQVADILPGQFSGRQQAGIRSPEAHGRLIIATPGLFNAGKYHRQGRGPRSFFGPTDKRRGTSKEIDPI